MMRTMEEVLRLVSRVNSRQTAVRVPLSAEPAILPLSVDQLRQSQLRHLACPYQNI